MVRGPTRAPMYSTVKLVSVLVVIVYWLKKVSAPVRVTRAVPVLFVLIATLLLLVKERIIVNRIRAKAMRGQLREPREKPAPPFAALGEAAGFENHRHDFLEVAALHRRVRGVEKLCELLR